MGRLEGRVALVTGSSRGIGLVIAERFAAERALIALHGRDAEALARARSRIEGQGGRCISVRAEITSFKEIEQLRSEVESRLGPVEILVANAGGSLSPPGPLEETDEGAWQATVNANLTSTFLTLKAFLPGMKARRSGNILTISSSAARRPHVQSPVPYAAAKAGIQMLTQHLAEQVGPFGIRVNCLAPETILTERNRERIPAATQEALVAMHPVRRLGTPADVAEAALFLVAPESGWLTGLILDISGGAVMPR
jgi:3-oxoacyl-[acyl-carrier protein] reductase